MATNQDKKVSQTYQVPRRKATQEDCNKMNNGGVTQISLTKKEAARLFKEK